MVEQGGIVVGRVDVQYQCRIGISCGHPQVVGQLLLLSSRQIGFPVVRNPLGEGLVHVLDFEHSVLSGRFR